MKIKHVFFTKQLRTIEEENEKLKVFIEYLTDIRMLLDEFFSKAISYENE